MGQPPSPTALTRCCRRRNARGAALRRAALRRCPCNRRLRHQSLSARRRGAVILALARVDRLRAAKPLDPECGAQAPLLVASHRRATCIGCTLCIRPVRSIDPGGRSDAHCVAVAVLGMRGVRVAPCPVDCITLQPAGRGDRHDDATLGARAVRRTRRAARTRNEHVARRTVTLAPASAHLPACRSRTAQAAVAAALARARGLRTVHAG